MEDKTTNIKERVLQIAETKGIAKERFFEKIGMSYGNFKGKSKTTPLNSNAIEDISSMFPDISLKWLITGQGKMIDKEDSDDLQEATAYKQPPHSPNSIPLIPVEAFAGAATNNGYAVDFDTIEERYNVPLFDNKGVDFMLYVRGASMYPRYSNGDIVACKFVKERIFIQWNKVYVIDTKSQGAMIKRLLPSQDPEYITCRSDNPEYLDFDVPLCEINNLALVIGCIRLE